VSDSSVHSGSPLAAQHVDRIQCRGEGPFGPEALDAVDRLGEDLLAHVGHAHLVEVGEGQGDPDADASGVLVHGVRFRAQVLGGLVQKGQELAHSVGSRLGKKRVAYDHPVFPGCRIVARFYLISELMSPTLPGFAAPPDIRCSVFRSLAVEMVRLLEASRYLVFSSSGVFLYS
jgi:hypothetical protein